LKVLIPITFLFLLPVYGRAQNSGLGSWNIINGKYTINKKISLFAEAQLRSLFFYSQFHYHEYKGGINFKATPQITISLGAGDYNTYSEGGNFKSPVRSDEFRIWPQLLLQQNLGKLKMEQRFRTEFRFTNTGYRTRLRYRLGLTKNFGTVKNGAAIYQAGVTNELFFSLKEPYFERNRLQFFISKRVAPMLVIQAGYLHQFDYRINDETGRDFLQTGLLFDIK
jgi:Protein of unknown function (DUF2490)